MRVLFFAHLKNVTGCGEMQLSAQNTNAEGLWRSLLQAHPGLGKYRDSVRLAKNSEYVNAEAQFTDTDEVALIPPVSGG